jgi:putative tryptophan/tyrosine transport system substrate-binding protein
MRRRDFFGALGSAAAWPLAARAQQTVTPVIGFLGTGTAGAVQDAVAAFHRGLRETGYTEGQNVVVEYRWADGQYERLPQLASELVSQGVAVIVTTGGSQAALAAKMRTSTIPIVFSSGGDPVRDGLVQSLSRPAGNITGASFLTDEVEAKRLQLLHELVPDVGVMGFLIASRTDSSATDSKAQMQAAAAALGLKLVTIEVAAIGQLEAAFAGFVQQGAGALLVASSATFNSQRNQIVALAARHTLPAIYQLRSFVEAGGLISYGANGSEAYHQVGVYVGRILKGAKPADLPVVLPTKFELVINLRTAKALGLSVSRDMQLIADEVIE